MISLLLPRDFGVTALNLLTERKIKYPYTWGNLLKTYEDSDNVSITYTYDADGMRTGKTVTVTPGQTQQHTVIFMADGVRVGSITVDDGAVLTDADYPAVPPKSGFTGAWNKYTSPVTEDIFIQATYTSTGSGSDTHTVTFRVTYYGSSSGNVVKTMTVPHGYVLTAADYPTSTTSYMKYNWQFYTSPITSDITVNGTYSYSFGGSSIDDSTSAAMSTPRSTQSDAVVVDYQYIYNGDKLSRLVKTPQATPNAADTLNFTYDASGTPLSVEYNGTTYYYVTNIQGDVTSIVNTSGTTVVEYTYDAWGTLLSTTGSMAATLGEDNPLRYRGYVYDTETQLYYLQSRYYNPHLGRFINADAFAATGQGFIGNNMFAYCNNNPVNYLDPTGTRIDTFDPLRGGHLVGGGCAGVSSDSSILFSLASLLAGVEVISFATTNDTAEEHIYSVYFLCKKGDPSKEIVYVGRVKTANLSARMNYHKHRGRELVYVISGLSYPLCRAIEQAGMMYYNTRNRNNDLNNKIRGISPSNGNRHAYLLAVLELIMEGLYPQNTVLPIEYWENLTEEAFLNGSL